MDPNAEPNASPEVPVKGAFELFEGNREELITLTRSGKLLEIGDVLPAVPEVGQGPFILHTVNAFGTETCDSCVDYLEAYSKQEEGIPVYSLTKQPQEDIEKEDQKAGRSVSQPRLTIDQDTAVDLGIALAPGEGADEEFWPTALRRTVAVVDSAGKVVYIEHPDDQEQVPDFDRLFKAASAAS